MFDILHLVFPASVSPDTISTERDVWNSINFERRMRLRTHSLASNTTSKTLQRRAPSNANMSNIQKLVDGAVQKLQSVYKNVSSPGKTVFDKERDILYAFMNSSWLSSLIVKYPSRLSGISQTKLENILSGTFKTIRASVPADWDVIYLTTENDDDTWFIPCEAYLVTRQGAEKLILLSQGMSDTLPRIFTVNVAS